MLRSMASGSGQTQRIGRAFAALAASLAVLVVTLRAGAQPSEPRGSPDEFLTWQAPVGCPSADAVYLRTRDTVGYPPEKGRFDRVSGRIVQSGRAWELTLELLERGEHKSRLLRADRCAALEGAAAVAIALALGDETPEAAGEPGPRAGATVPSGLQPAPTDIERDDVSVRADASPLASQRISWSAWAGTLVDFESLGQTVFGAALEGRASWPRLQLAVQGLWLPEAERRVRSNEAVAFSLIALGPRACYRVLDSSVVVLACGSGEVGRFSASGAGLSAEARRFDRGWLAAGASVELQAALARSLRASFRSEALRPLLREEYTVNATQNVYATPSVSLRLYLGLELSTD